MTRDELQRTLQQPYQRDRWRQTLRGVLPGTELFTVAQPVAAANTQARQIHQLGRVRLAGGRNLAALEIVLDPTVDLIRNRVGLRNLVARFIDQAEYHGVLAVFTTNRPDYRFTFAARESSLDEQASFTRHETAPRRYTYLLGPNESCRTAAERFDLLARRGERTELKDVVEAFNVEKLNKEFFADFRKAFEMVAKDILDRNSGWERAAAERETQTLLSRLLFLYFIQRKGWLNRQRDYLIRHFRRVIADAPDGSSFYDQFLRPFFVRLSDSEAYFLNLDLGDLPFLNGGLFDDEIGSLTERGRMKVGNPALRHVFDHLLEAYNFTVREDTPLDQEVAIDPEMLGKIFESLVLQLEQSDTGGKTSRHDTGSYYTPRPIVHYLCREGLRAWLEQFPPQASPSPFAESAERGERAGVRGENRKSEIANRKSEWPSRLEKLFALDAADGLDDTERATLHELLTPDEARAVLDRLDDFRACDPAVGSGAFLVGLLHELVNLRRLCETRSRGKDPAADLEWLYETKKRVIENVLYGVDLQQRAVEICKLRLWISLMVDYPLEVDPDNCALPDFRKALRKITPLPNLDFKIRRANSLIEQIRGHAVKFPQTAADSRDFNLSLNKLASAKHRFYEARKKKDKRLTQLDILEATAELAKYEFSAAKLKYGLLPSDQDAERAAELARAEAEMGKLQMQIAAARKKGERDKDGDIERLSRVFNDEAKPTFVWQLDFAEIFHRSSRREEAHTSLLPDETRKEKSEPPHVGCYGFDLVIGNPPYLRIQTLTQAAPAQAAQIKDRYASAQKGNYDIYVVFAERSLELLSPGGQLAFILPHKFFNAQYGEPLRELLAKGKHLRHVVHFGDQQIFPGATNYVCLMFLTSAGADACRWVRADNLPEWLQTFRAPETELPAARLTAAEWNFAVGKNAGLFERLQRMPLKLSDVADIFVGLQTSADDVFILNFVSETAKTITLESKAEKTWTFEKELLHPIVSGTDVSAYTPLPNRQFILFPYTVENEDVELISLKHLSDSWPRTAEYLRENKQRLEGRESSKLKGSARWHGYIYLKNMARQSLPKLCVPRLVEYLHAAPDFGGTHFLDNVDVGGVTFKEPFVNHNLAYLLALLNSRVARWFFPQISAPFRGGFRSANKQFLSLLPFRAIDFSVASERAEHDALVGLVEQCLAARGENCGAWESEINARVARLYGLTPAEIQLVEEATKK